MLNFFRKLRRFGFRRACILVFVKTYNIFRVVAYRTAFSDNSPKINKSKILMPVQFVGKGLINLDCCQLGVWPSPKFVNGSGYLEVRSEDAKIVIGRGTVINNNFSFIADKSSIVIGQRCLIGPNFFVTDSDFHGLELSKRTSSDYGVGSVVIEDDVFIGEGVRVLKSSFIGRGAVVASGSVVIGKIESLAIYGGIPARRIALLKEV